MSIHGSTKPSKTRSIKTSDFGQEALWSLKSVDSVQNKAHRCTYMLDMYSPAICELPSSIWPQRLRFCSSWRRPFRSQKAPEIYQSEKWTKRRRQSGHNGHNIKGAFKIEYLWCYLVVRVEIISILSQKLPLHGKSSCLFVFACCVTSSSTIEQGYPGGTLSLSAT